MSRASASGDERVVRALMREALVEAKLGVSNLRAGVEQTRERLQKERAELETVQRRGRLAAQIRDEETVRVATEFEQRHAERVQVLERKLAVQTEEVAMAEREIAEMTAQLKQSALGIDPAAARAAVEPDPLDADAERLQREADRAAREATAQRQLDELKRRMGR